MADGVILSPEAWDRVSAAVKQVEQSARDGQSQQPDDAPLVFGHDALGLFLNDTSEEESVPPFAVLISTDYDLSDDDPVIKVDQPDTDFSEPIVNGPDVIDYGEFAPIQRGRFLKVRFDPDDLEDDELTFGDFWGVKESQYELAKGYPGDFMALGIFDDDESIGWFSYSPCLALIGKADETIDARDDAAPGSGTVTIWIFDGTDYIETDLTVTAYNLSAGTVPSGKFLQLKRVNGLWFIDVVYC